MKILYKIRFIYRANPIKGLCKKKKKKKKKNLSLKFERAIYRLKTLNRLIVLATSVKGCDDRYLTVLISS